VLRPPGATWDGCRYTGPGLVSVDDTPLSSLRVPVHLVRYANFVGVVAQQHAVAQDAATRLRVRWADADPLQPHKVDARVSGTTDSGIASAAEGADELLRHYRWPAHAQHVMSPAIAVARWHGNGVDVWVNCEAPAALRADLARLFRLPPDVVRIWGNGMPPTAAARDLAADAAWLSQAVGRPVRVQAASDTQADGARQYLDVKASVRLAGDDRIVGYRTAATELPWGRPPVAGLLIDAEQVSRYAATAASYAFAQTHTGMGGDVALDVLSSGHARAAAHVFARESLLDEAAVVFGIDPVELRLQHIDDTSGARLVRDVAQRSGWQPRRSPIPGSGTGRGFAYACTVDDTVDPPLKSWSAWVADVSVDAEHGSVDITRLVVGHNLQDMAEPDMSAQRLQGEVQQAAQRVLAAPASFDTWGDAEGAPAAAIPRVELINITGDCERLPSPSTLAAGAALTLPAAAAVSNAIYEATGVRLREPPFGGASLQRALSPSPSRMSRVKRACAWVAGVAAASAGLAMTAMPWRTSIAPVAQPDLSVYSAAAIERGRRVAAVGDCAVCHTAPGGVVNAGGLALDTPFGTIYTTNITPDPETGIGNWSYPAFERAMREGIHRDGRHLYPAFPYTAFAKLTDADMQALYAYLMSQPAVKAAPVKTKLAFPYNFRPLLAAWNTLFHDASGYRPDPDQSVQWNRGAYLVQGAGHCGACHTPRNAFGAEKSGPLAFLGGGEAEGWHAPALNALSRSPRRWTEEDLFQYLRTGFSPNHGVAAGPMGPVVQGLASLPESDVRAIAVYLASLGAPDTSQQQHNAAALAPLQQPGSTPAPQVLSEAGERVFKGACAACHEALSGPVLFGVKPSLDLNTNLQSDQPDNLIQVILHGIQDPAHDSLGYMPAFAASLDDDQIAEVVGYLRVRYGGGKPAWSNVKERVRSLRDARVPEHVAAR
jgi:nicotinate dehydrogenase subunit B